MYFGCYSRLLTHPPGLPEEALHLFRVHLDVGAPMRGGEGAGATTGHRVGVEGVAAVR